MPEHSDYLPWLNQSASLLTRLRDAVAGASSLDLAVAHAKMSGVAELLASLPAHTRAVIGLGFGLSDPEAVEHLAKAGVEVRVVIDSLTLSASRFHPELYVVTSTNEVTVFSGSGDLTAGGLRDNVEQFEELRFTIGAPEARAQHDRFEHLWDKGTDLAVVRRRGEWDEYIAAAEARRALERQFKRRRPSKRSRRRASALQRDRLPGWIGITDGQWWDNQRALHDPRGPVFMRGAGAGRFRRLEPGGLFFYLIARPGDSEPERAVEGFSEFRDDFEFATAEQSWRDYGARVGYPTRAEYVGDDPGYRLGLIVLEPLHEFARRISLTELRANGVEFSRGLRQGRGLTSNQVATILELAGQ
jgi:HKD family nuclease